ncbi:MAG: nucleotidyltransferase domain-containing protein, partial [Lachnospiraceae bacterium]|nr:nucleotidyltransferase domain-containing protein [Lachnospiraceae bacterium]
MKFTESMLENYSQPLSATEDAQCKNAISMVRDALKAFSYTDDNQDITPLYSDTLAYAIEMRSIDGMHKIKLFVQGSYANNTNVRTESDVDIAVVEENPFR